MIVGSALALPTMAGPPSKGEKLVALRFEVDEKEKRLEAMRSRVSAEKAALEAQVADLHILVGKERVRKSTLAKMERAQREAREKRTSQTARYREPALGAAKVLRSLINDSLPFKKQARLKEVDVIVADLEGDKVDAATAITRLWRLIEDELKLVSEVGLHRQPILLNGEKMLADVVRIGMSVLYFRVDEKRLGRAIRTPKGGFIYEETKKEDEKRALNALFEAMEKQIRKGAFELPLPERSDAE